MERRDKAFNTDCKRSNKVIASIATTLPKTTPKKTVRFAENLTTYIPLTSDISFVPSSVVLNKHPQLYSIKINVNSPTSTTNVSRPILPLEPLPSPLDTAIDIALISGPGFQLSASKRFDNEIFAITIHELNSLIEEKQNTLR
ncbi:hypothetical protein K3495_g17084, partial [Podosphaera aphanis]